MQRWVLGWLALLSAVGGTHAGDWIHWRGPEQNGVSREVGLPDKWSPLKAGENNLVWKYAAGCRSTPLVMGGRVFIINNVVVGNMEQERVLALDEKTGGKLWEYRFNVFLTDIVSNRLGWTNLAADPDTGNVYAHGTSGLLMCLSRDGKLLWQHSLTEEYGRVSGYGGRIISPIVDEDLVIMGMPHASWGDYARGANRFVAFDKRTGAVVWWSDPCDLIKGTYTSCPVIAVINGQRLYITGCGDGYIRALQVRTGKSVWGLRIAAGVVNSSPIVAGNRVFIMHGEENPEEGKTKGRIVCLDASQLTPGVAKDGGPPLAATPKVVWEVVGEIEAEYTTPVLVGNRLYVADNRAKLYCLDADTGHVVWKRPYNYGRLSRGSPIFADGKLYIFDVNANFHILKPTDKGCEELHKQFFKNPDGAGFVETNGTPALANGRLFIGTRDEIYCIGKPDWQPSKLDLPAPVAEPAANPQAEIAQLQVVPADVVLTPGQSATFAVKGFTANGQFVKMVSAEWSLPQPPLPPMATTRPPALEGELSEALEERRPVDVARIAFTASKKPSQQGFVLATVGKLTARARVRVAPSVPFTQDFERIPAGAVPGGWVNTQGKYVVVEQMLDGKPQKLLQKVANNPSPLVARAYAYMTVPTARGYEVQADLMAERKHTKLPDMGILSHRYTLILDGKESGDPMQVRIVTWEAVPRINQGANFTWKEGVWYTSKLVVELQADKAIVRGKVWPRSEKEPDQWTVEVEDPLPNREGAAGLYGYVSKIPEGEAGPAIFYDNVSVTPAAKK
jgi:outer membrane protein assembly factor BamB